jgi:hypothetical protein
MKRMFILGLAVLAQSALANDAPRVCVKNVSDKAKLRVVRGGKDGIIQKTKRGLAKFRSGLAQNEQTCFKLGKDKSSLEVTVWYVQDESDTTIKKVFDLKQGNYDIGLKETKAGNVPFIHSQYPESKIGLKEYQEKKEVKEAKEQKKKMEKETKKMNRKKAAEEAEEDLADQD